MQPKIDFVDRDFKSEGVGTRRIAVLGMVAANAASHGALATTDEVEKDLCRRLKQRFSQEQVLAPHEVERLAGRSPLPSRLLSDPGRTPFESMLTPAQRLRLTDSGISLGLLVVVTKNKTYSRSALVTDSNWDGDGWSYSEYIEGTTNRFLEAHYELHDISRNRLLLRVSISNTFSDSSQISPPPLFGRKYARYPPAPDLTDCFVTFTRKSLSRLPR